MFKNLFYTLVLVSFASGVHGQNAARIKADTSYHTPIKIIPSNYYTKGLGVVCKQELRLQKATGLNLFFRVGSKEHVDYLEQKPNAPKRIF
ncbi:MAG TPA: hypothetical protein VEY06_14035 [Flavisolibacter sp.]|jgi:hypothetical protein|nr:hypothetical protein [Flavisolibacter sp.]